MFLTVILLALVAAAIWGGVGFFQPSQKKPMVKRQQIRQARLESMRLARETDEALRDNKKLQDLPLGEKEAQKAQSDRTPKE